MLVAVKAVAAALLVPGAGLVLAQPRYLAGGDVAVVVCAPRVALLQAVLGRLVAPVRPDGAVLEVPRAAGIVPDVRGGGRRGRREGRVALVVERVGRRPVVPPALALAAGVGVTQ